MRIGFLSKLGAADDEAREQPPNLPKVGSSSQSLAQLLNEDEDKALLAAIERSRQQKQQRTQGEATEQGLLEEISSFRERVADALYESSTDYQILCNLTHSDLKACDLLIGELRKRLAGDLHYAVLAKLDEAHSLAGRLAKSRPQVEPRP